MKSIYWLSDSPFTCTGYSTISTNILNGLSDLGYDCRFQAHNYCGQTLVPPMNFEDGKQLKFKVMGCGMAPFSQDLLVPRIREFKPDVFGILLDTFMCYPWLLNLDLAPAKTIFYFPSDGGAGMPLRCDNILRKVHHPVAMSKFAQRQVKEMYGIDCEYIPHAVDTDNYFLLNEEERYKLKCNWGLKDKYVVGCVYRNQGRKMPDRHIKAFAKFCRDKPDAILLMHTDAFDNAAVFDSMELVRRLHIENRVMFTGMKFYKGLDYKKMNEIYNLMDVYFSSSSGEGFGVCTIEAMACGVPVINTDYTTTPELLIEDGVCGIPIPLVGCEEVSFSQWIADRYGKDSFEFIKYDELVNSGTLTGNWNVERAIMSIDKAEEALTKLYNDRELGKQMGKVGREKVLKYYDWKVVIPQWDALIKKITEEK